MTARNGFDGKETDQTFGFCLVAVDQTVGAPGSQEPGGRAAPLRHPRET
jgi:hypothetical protein